MIKKYENWWQLTIEERATAQMIIVDISVRLSNWKDKDSGIAWDE